MTKIIGLINQKGGVGKSTISLFLCKYLHYYKGYNVAFIDADDLQLSIYKRRTEELKLYNKNEILKEVVKKQKNPNLFNIYRIDHNSTIKDIISDLLKKDQYDYIIIDTKGATTDTTIQLKSICTYIFVPVVPKLLVCEGTIPTAELLFSVKEKVWFFWNLYKKSSRIDDEKKVLQKKFFSVFQFLKNGCTDRINIARRNLFNTLYYSPKEMEDETGELVKMLNEIHEIIK